MSNRTNVINYIENYFNQPKHIIAEKCLILEPKSFPLVFIEQYKIYKNPYVFLIVVPDNWLSHKKGLSVHEAHPNMNLSVFSLSRFNKGEDIYGAFSHDLAHIRQYYEIGKLSFENNQQKKVYDDINNLYPNNLAELYAFGSQFEYLMNYKAKSPDFILNYLTKCFSNNEDDLFFRRVLNNLNHCCPVKMKS